MHNTIKSKEYHYLKKEKGIQPCRIIYDKKYDHSICKAQIYYSKQAAGPFTFLYSIKYPIGNIIQPFIIVRNKDPYSYLFFRTWSDYAGYDYKDIQITYYPFISLFDDIILRRWKAYATLYKSNPHVI